MIEVKINGVVKWQVNEYTVVDPQMGIRSISLTVTHPSDNATVPSFVGAYGCELLSKVDIFDIRNNSTGTSTTWNTVVNCSQKLISLIFGTTCG